jgi:SagB-type dehydrogenase family enzyme
MAKKILFLFFALLFNLLLLGQGTETIQLPQAEKSGGMPVMEALQNRRSQRSFSEKDLPLQTLSNLLWAAYGVNRQGGKRTVPSAMGWNEFDIYLVQPDGWFWYNPLEHNIVKKGDADLRTLACTQKYGQSAPLNLVFVADYSRMEKASQDEKQLYAAMDVGFIAQNVYLFCASEKLATIVRASVNKEKLREEMNLLPNQHILLGQTVGYPGE